MGMMIISLWCFLRQSSLLLLLILKVKGFERHTCTNTNDTSNHAAYCGEVCYYFLCNQTNDVRLVDVKTSEIKK